MIQVIHRALSILEYLATDPDKEFSLAEISDRFKLNRATCANILKTLCNREYVEHNARKSGYRLGRMAYLLTNSRSYNKYLIKLSEGTMSQLNRNVNETVILSVIQNYQRLMLKELPSEHEIQVKTSTELRVYRATTARLMISDYDDQQLEELVEHIGLPDESEWPGVDSIEKMKEELAKLRKQEIVVTVNSSGVVGLATPILYNGKIIASLGIYLPHLRYTEESAAVMKRELLAATKEINDRFQKGFMSNNINQ